MNKTTVYVIAVITLILGLVLGYVGATLFGVGKAGQVRNAELKVGDRAPDFRLRDHTGRTIELRNYVGEKNIVLTFLPGAFTPI
ncbi:MAG: redoxin domain-containing protein [Chloroflexi bacterium]|nr:redoxin domain-containing protein [Chloroflexota bacterium]